MFTKIAIAFVFIFALAACTDDDKSARHDSPGTSSSTSAGPTDGPSEPACADIWKEGGVLPKDYEGCVSGGKPGNQESVDCQDSRSLIVFEEVFYAVTGGTIRKPADAPLQDTEEYGKAFTACTGE